MKFRSSLALAALALALAGCSSNETHEAVERPVRFAVLAAPELGADDGDLLSAVTRLSREKELGFVLVIGPLFAPDADATSLESFKNDLGQVAAPVYVAFSSAAVVGSATPARKLGADEILAALEGMGPGAAHKLGYVARPDRARSVAVNALAPDGTGAVPALPADARRLVRFGTVPVAEKDAAAAAVPDIIVGVAAGAAVELEGVRGTDAAVADGPVHVLVPPFAKKTFAVVTVSDVEVVVTPVALEGPPPAAPRPVAAPLIRRKPPG